MKTVLELYVAAPLAFNTSKQLVQIVEASGLAENRYPSKVPFGAPSTE